MNNDKLERNQTASMKGQTAPGLSKEVAKEVDESILQKRNSNSLKPEIISFRINWEATDDVNRAAQLFVKDCLENKKKVSTTLKELIYEHIKSRDNATGYDEDTGYDKDPYPWKCNICEESDGVFIVGKPDINGDKVNVNIDCNKEKGLRLIGKRTVSLKTWESIKDKVVYDK